MLETLITSKTPLRILVIFFINAANKGYLRGLAEEMHESTNAIRKELNNLEEAGYLKKEAVQNRISYKANTQHPLYKTLKNIIFQHIGLDSIVEMVLDRMGEVKKIIVIGSIASQLQCVSFPGLEQYQQQKKELDIVCNTLRYPTSHQVACPCSLITIHPGFVDTNIFSMASPIARPPMDQMLSVAQVVDMVDYVLRSPINIDTVVLRK